MKKRMRIARGLSKQDKGKHACFVVFDDLRKTEVNDIDWFTVAKDICFGGEKDDRPKR